MIRRITVPGHTPVRPNAKRTGSSPRRGDRRLGGHRLACVDVAHQQPGLANERTTSATPEPPDRHIPQLPGQSDYGKQLRAAGPLITAVINGLARDTDS
jgi:hypothetical protein